jgi:hypothetical protein
MVPDRGDREAALAEIRLGELLDRWEGTNGARVQCRKANRLGKEADVQLQPPGPREEGVDRSRSISQRSYGDVRGPGGSPIEQIRAVEPGDRSSSRVRQDNGGSRNRGARRRVEDPTPDKSGRVRRKLESEQSQEDAGCHAPKIVRSTSVSQI